MARNLGTPATAAVSPAGKRPTATVAPTVPAAMTGTPRMLATGSAATWPAATTGATATGTIATRIRSAMADCTAAADCTGRSGRVMTTRGAGRTSRDGSLSQPAGTPIS